MKRSVMFLLVIECIFGISAQKMPYPPSSGPDRFYSWNGRECEYIYCGYGWQSKFKHGSLELILNYPIGVYRDTGEIEAAGSVLVEGCDIENYELGDTIMLYSDLYHRYYPLRIYSVSTGANESIKNITSARIGFDYPSSSSMSGLTGLKELKIGPLYMSWDNILPMCTGCTELTRVDIPRNLTRIWQHGFEGCKKLTTLELHDSILQIDEHAFDGSGIKHIKIPPRVKNISDYTFYNCDSLKEIELPAHCAKIGKHAFDGCKNLQTVVWPDTAFTIDEYAFCASGFQSLQLPETLTGTGLAAFYNCGNLIDIYVPQSLTKIGDRMFDGCKKLKNVSLNPNMRILGGEMFKGCSSISEITLPNVNLAKIPHSIFSNCTSLKKIEIPDNVKSIGYDAFYGCSSLTSASFNVDLIGEMAFKNCHNLRTVYSKAEYPPKTYYQYENWGGYRYYSIFAQTTLTDGTLFVPTTNSIYKYTHCNKDNIYNTQPDWHYFAKYIAMDSDTGVDGVTVTDGPAVEVTAGGVVLTGADGGAVSVYSADGRLVYGSQCYDGATLPLPSGQLYIIVTNGKPMKVAL